MSEFAGTKIGADGRRHPQGTEPTDPRPYWTPRHGPQDSDVEAIAEVETTEFGRSLLALPDSAALSDLAGGGIPQEKVGAGVELFAAEGPGSVAGGLAYAPEWYTTSSEVKTTEYARGAFAFGCAYGGGVISAEDYGAVAMGYVSGDNGVLRASGPGSVAVGFAKGFGAGEGGLVSSSNGSIVMGAAGFEGLIQATSHGAMAAGYARSAYNISATGMGAMAFGSTWAGDGFSYGDIAATARNAVQFGIGTNAVPDSVAVGDGGLRFRGRASDAPADLRNGDVWVDASGDVCVRTGGVTKNLTTVT